MTKKNKKKRKRWFKQLAKELSRIADQLDRYNCESDSLEEQQIARLTEFMRQRMEASKKAKAAAEVKGRETPTQARKLPDLHRLLVDCGVADADPYLMGGVLCFKGTRIPLGNLLADALRREVIAKVANDMSVDEALLQRALSRVAAYLLQPCGADAGRQDLGD